MQDLQTREQEYHRMIVSCTDAGQKKTLVDSLTLEVRSHEDLLKKAKAVKVAKPKEESVEPVM